MTLALQTKKRTNFNREADSDASSRARQKKDVQVKAQEQRARAVALAKRLALAAEACGSRRALNRAYLIGRCSDAENVWVARGLEDKEGREFDAFGVKSSCSSLMCSHCLKNQQKRAQHRLVEARDRFWRTHKREFGKLERFVTLTAPTLQGFSEYQGEKVFNRAFVLLNDRAFWSERVEAGAKHLEFTVNERGYHPHIHVMFYGSFMERDADREAATVEWRKKRDKENAANLRAGRLGKVADNVKRPTLGNLQDEWMECVTQAAREFGRWIEWGANFDASLNDHVLGAYSLLETRERVIPDVKEGWYSQWPLIDGKVVEVQPTHARKPVIDIRVVREKGKPDASEIGIADAVKELTKYITKASSWDAVPDSHLVEIAEVKRWPRRFELLKGWRKQPETKEQKAKREVDEAKRAADEAAKRAGTILHINAGETYEAFCLRVESGGYSPNSYVIAWDNLNSSHMLYHATRSVNAFLDTDFISWSDLDEEVRPPPEKPADRTRQPSLMALGDVMEFTEWKKLVSVRLIEARRSRQRLLAEKYPTAQFDCLDGSTFYGTDIQDEREGKKRIERVDAICARLEYGVTLQPLFGADLSHMKDEVAATRQNMKWE